MTFSEYPKPKHNDRLITIEQVTKLIPYSRATIYRMIKAGQFPPAIRLGPNRVAWKQCDIDEWIDDRTAGGFIAL